MRKCHISAIDISLKNAYRASHKVGGRACNHMFRKSVFSSSFTYNWLMHIQGHKFGLGKYHQLCQRIYNLRTVWCNRMFPIYIFCSQKLQSATLFPSDFPSSDIFYTINGKTVIFLYEVKSEKKKWKNNTFLWLFAN